MRRPVIASMLAASMLTTSLPIAPGALAQPAPPAATAPATPAPATPAPAAPAPAAPAPATPQLSLDQTQLPPLPPIIPAAQRDQMVLMASGAGAAIGILVADVLTGGLLLAPLGIPSASNLLVAAGPAAAAPTYSVAQRVLAGIATMAAAVGGGYLGGYIARSRPDIIRLGE